ncbi:PPOX class F420-dependent oxidoreductase [Streptomyces sp. 4N509B]|uniref:PPOX class F420-dependent oxidoreductase n=1 Tax=Streptomyces sp. 4N509B TaxID=3457413 RepID=UPI003FD22528
MSFTDEELAYIGSQPLARIATVAGDQQPDVVPVGFEFDGTHFHVGGRSPERTRKYRNVAAGNEKVSLLLDDLASLDPWAPRFLRVYGDAELVERDGRFGRGTYLRIAPRVSWSFNLDGRPLSEGPATRRTEH